MSYKYPLDMARFRVRHAIVMTRAQTDPNGAFSAMVDMLSDLAGFDVADMPFYDYQQFMAEAAEQMSAYFATQQQTPRLSIIDVFASAIDNELGPATFDDIEPVE